MKVYISGPITGYPDSNSAAFSRAEDMLRMQGHEVVNPLGINADHEGPCVGGVFPEHDADHGHRYGCHLRADILRMFECDAIWLLPNWEESKGARAEAQIAKALRLVIL
jgi:hypothetical protein